MQKIFLALLFASAVTFSNSPLFAQADENSADRRNRGVRGKTELKQGDKNPKRKKSSARNGQQRRPNANLLFTRLDQNEDGVITADEAPERMKRRLKQMDTDNSESISKEEFVAAFQRRMQAANQNQAQSQRRKREGQKKGDAANRQMSLEEMTPENMIARLDKNNDQMISLEEVPKRMRDKFAKLDSDGDDQLNKKEIVSMIERMKASSGKSSRYSTDPDKTNGQMPKRPPRK